MAESQQSLGLAQQPQLDRFERLGLSVRPMSDGRCLLVVLPTGPAPFETLAGPLPCKRIVFSTVGEHAIKCLRPRPLFGLPLIDIRTCSDAHQIEWAIRQAWREYTNSLRDCRKVLGEIGIETQVGEVGSVVSFQLPGEAPDARVMMQKAGEAILPSAGPLSGIALLNRSERVLDVQDQLGSGSDLAVRLGNRVSALAHVGHQRSDHERHQPAPVPVPRSQPKAAHPRIQASRQPKVLIVGSELVSNEALRTSLANQGYRVSVSNSEVEALLCLAGMSPDLVVSQYALGRSDGASLVAAMSGLPGIEKIPVVLIDEKDSDGRRETAKSVGAAGYLVSPPSPARFVTRLARLIEAPSKRRFTRYQRHLSAHLDGLKGTSIVTELGRGGVFIKTATRLAPHTAMHCQMSLPELGHTLRFGGEVIYTGESQGERRGLGLRFFDISPEDETTLIEYLTWLEAHTNPSRGSR